MPNKKRKFSARFPPARIKKIMQKDEDVGKVAVAVPVIISRALEMFIEALILKSAETTKARNAKTLSSSHIKQTILSEKKFDFLKDLVAHVPDVQGEEEGVEGLSSHPKPPSVRRPPQEPRPTTSGTAAGKRPRGRPRKVKPEEEVVVPKATKRKKKEESSEEEEEEEEDSDTEHENEDTDMEDEHEDSSMSHNDSSTATVSHSWGAPHNSAATCLPSSVSYSLPQHGVGMSTAPAVYTSGSSSVGPQPMDMQNDIKQIDGQSNFMTPGDLRTYPRNFYGSGEHFPEKKEHKETHKMCEQNVEVKPPTSSPDTKYSPETTVKTVEHMDTTYKKSDSESLSVKEMLSYKLKFGLLPNTSISKNEEIMQSSYKPDHPVQDSHKNTVLPTPPALIPSPSSDKVPTSAERPVETREAHHNLDFYQSRSSNYAHPPPPLISHAKDEAKMDRSSEPVGSATAKPESGYHYPVSSDRPSMYQTAPQVEGSHSPKKDRRTEHSAEQRDSQFPVSMQNAAVTNRSPADKHYDSSRQFHSSYNTENKPQVSYREHPTSSNVPDMLTLRSSPTMPPLVHHATAQPTPNIDERRMAQSHYNALNEPGPRPSHEHRLPSKYGGIENPGHAMHQNKPPTSESLPRPYPTSLPNSCLSSHVNMSSSARVTAAHGGTNTYPVNVQSNEHTVLDLSSSKNKTTHTDEKPTTPDQRNKNKVSPKPRDPNKDKTKDREPRSTPSSTPVSLPTSSQQSMTQAQEMMTHHQMAALAGHMQQQMAAGLAAFPHMLAGFGAPHGLYPGMMMPGYPGMPPLPPHLAMLAGALGNPATAPPIWPYAGMPPSALQSTGASATAAAALAHFTQQQQQLANGSAARSSTSHMKSNSDHRPPKK